MQAWFTEMGVQSKVLEERAMRRAVIAVSVICTAPGFLDKTAP